MKVERLRALMDERNFSQADLAKRVGATQGSIQQILSGTTQRSRFLPDIARTFGVSVDYLLGITDDPRSARQAQHEGAPLETIADERVVAVQIMDFSRGSSNRYLGEFHPGDDVDLTYLDREFIQHLTAAPATKLFLVRGLGDAMAPTLPERATVLVDELQDKIIAQDAIWAIRYGGVEMVRRIRSLGQDRYLITSDNSAVDNFETDGEGLEVVGRVVWMSRPL